MAESTYTTHDLTGNYFTMTGWYLFYMPVSVPYQSINTTAQEMGYTIDESEGMLEHGAKFGKGWIGVKIQDELPVDDPKVKKITGTFTAYEFVGPYKKMGKAYSIVMKDYPNIAEMYHVYVTNPEVTPEDQNKTLILFR